LEAQLQSSRSSYEGLKTECTAAKNQLASAQNNLATLEKTRANDLASANQNRNIAGLTRQQYQNSLSDAELTADVNGYVMAVNYKEGEIIGAGYPAVIIKSEVSVVTIGVSISDKDKITVGMPAVINGDIDATVDSVSEYPDESSRTYSVDISFSSDAISMGELVDVFIPLEEKPGSFIPIESILNVDGVDYVYTLNDDSTVSKTEVKLGEVRDNTVQVYNLENGTRVVTTSVKRLREKEAVTVKE
ncbi:MAG: efflux RND transporter periplasmic adaptor subunit, partial [Clostridia bacterium]